MNPYAASLGDRRAIDTLAETPEKLRMLVAAIGPAGMAESHAPGKWTVRQILVHLAQVELAFGVRARMALTVEHYVAQSFEQDDWLAREDRTDASAALAAYEALRAMNLALFRGLGPDDHRRTFVHPDRGPLTLQDLMDTLAGHELHHLGQLADVASRKQPAR